MTSTESKTIIELLQSGTVLQSSYPDYGGIQISYNQDTARITFERKYWANGAAQFEHRIMTDSEFEAYISTLYSSWGDFAIDFGL